MVSCVPLIAQQVSDLFLQLTFTLYCAACCVLENLNSVRQMRHGQCSPVQYMYIGADLNCHWKI